MDLLIVSCLLSITFILLSLGLYTVITLFFSKKRRMGNKDLNYHPEVTIIVPVHNEEYVIERKIQNIIQAEYPAEKIDRVIILDDNSTDSTVHRAISFLKERSCPLQFEAVEYRGSNGKARGLNWILPRIKTDVVLITDADVVWSKSSVVHLLANFANSQVGAVTGPSLIENSKSTLSSVIEKSYRDIYHVWRLGETNIDSVAFINGPLMAFRRSILSKISETCADDSYIAFEVRKKGFRAVYDPNAIVYERAPISFKAEIQQKMRRSRRYISVLLSNMSLLGKHGWFGNFIYPYMILLNLILPWVSLCVIFSSLALIFRYPLLLLFLSLLIFPKIRKLLSSYLVIQTSQCFSFFLPPISSWEPQRNETDNPKQMEQVKTE